MLCFLALMAEMLLMPPGGETGGMSKDCEAPLSRLEGKKDVLLLVIVEVTLD